MRKRGLLLCLFVALPISLVVQTLILNNKLAAQATGNTLTYAGLPKGIQAWLVTKQLTAENFPSYLATLQRETEERERDGEFEHLIYYILQSERFTLQPKIEPARSANEFINSFSAPAREKFLADENAEGMALPIAKPVERRLQIFLSSLTKQSNDARQIYFKKFLATHLPANTSAFTLLCNEYARVMKFLYRKEFLARAMEQPQQLAAYVARLYQTRGHSTDTQIEANYVLYDALAAIKAQQPSIQLQDILIVGPGMDFAPRTDLMDLFGPQSYQPFAVADALLSLQLCNLQKLRIHCVDINERVVDLLSVRAGQKSVPQLATLSLLSGLAARTDRPFSAAYQQYFAAFGHSIGTELPLSLPVQWQAHLQKKIQLKPEILAAISAEKLNIITHRSTTRTQFDLVIVTNVFPYFNDVELSLALTNIAAMTKPGGYWLHNESRNLLNHLALLLDVPPLQSRTVLIAGNQSNALFDGVVIHRKKTS